MKADELSGLSKETLAKMLQVMIDNYRSVDGLWFQFVEQQFGTAKAVELDEAVWRVLGKIEGRRVKKTFGLETDGIETILQAIDMNPSLSAFGPAEVERSSNSSLCFSVRECLPQKARLDKGQDLFPCRGVQMGYLGNFAAQINPQAVVRCVLCPPEHRDDDVWCQWTVEVGENGR